MRAAAFAAALAVVSVSGAVDEFLDAPAAYGLAHVQVAFGVDGHHVQECELSRHVARPPEAVEDCVRRPEQRGPVVEDPHDLVAAIGLVSEGLLPVGREIDVPRRAGRAECSRAGLDGYRTHAGAVPLTDVDALVGAIARIDEPVFADHDAMRMTAAAGGELPRAGAHAAHLAQVVSASVEHRHAVVAVAVGDIYAAALSGFRIRVGIDGDICRTMQECVAEAFGGRVPSANAVRRVTKELGPDLKQQGAAVVAPLLDHTIPVAADPHIVFVIDEAAMGAVRQNRVLASVRLSRGD